LRDVVDEEGKSLPMAATKARNQGRCAASKSLTCCRCLVTLGLYLLGNIAILATVRTDTDDLTSLSPLNEVFA
jgi:hypothetical protein